MKQRLDILLREWSLAPSRAKAQELIREGAVEILGAEGWRSAKDEAEMIDVSGRERVRLRENEVLAYVSRGGRKLEGALDEFGILVKGLRALDVGLSTGGFSDCLLKRGAVHVVGVDVGHGQLAESLKADPRLSWFDGVNARSLFEEPRLQEALKDPFDLVVVDVSFISLTAVLPAAVRALRSGGQLVALIKPQFEVGAGQLNKKGVVTDLELHRQVREKIKAHAESLGLVEIKDSSSQVVGQDGNQEYFLSAKKP